jgi:hypothetical protein
MSPIVHCLDSNDLYDVEFAPELPVLDWPALVQRQSGHCGGGTQPHQVCDDPGSADPSNPTQNGADSRFVCEGPPLPRRAFLPLGLLGPE